MFCTETAGAAVSQLSPAPGALCWVRAGACRQPAALGVNPHRRGITSTHRTTCNAMGWRVSGKFSLGCRESGTGLQTSALTVCKPLERRQGTATAAKCSQKGSADPVAVGKKLLQEAAPRPRGAGPGAAGLGSGRGAGETVFALRGLNGASRFLHRLVPAFCVCSIVCIL